MTKEEFEKLIRTLIRKDIIRKYIKNEIIKINTSASVISFVAVAVDILVFLKNNDKIF